MNLLSNAIKYTSDGYVRVSCSLDPFDATHFTIEVEDTGVGMNDEQLEKLFCPYTKFKQDRHLNKEGVGLGLIIVKRLT